jgi:hypothetical protein
VAFRLFGNRKKIIFFSIILVIIISISAWTIVSPQILSAQNSSQITSSLFQFAKATELVNISDSEGSYSFLFGIDYNNTASPGVPTIVEVFASLVTERINSGFLKGVGLELTHSTVLIDGVEDYGISSRSTTSGAILVERLSQIEINYTGGSHELSVHLVVSTEDVNYIGYVSGTEHEVSLNGTISISQ